MCKIKPEDITEDAEDIFAKVDQKYGRTLQGHISNRDLDKAHQTWNVLAEVFINMAHGQTEEEAVEKVESKWNRGTKPLFIKRQKTQPTNSNGDPVLHRQKEITNLRNRVNDLRQKTKKIDFGHNQVPEVETDDPMREKEDAEAEHIKN